MFALVISAALATTNGNAPEAPPDFSWWRSFPYQPQPIPRKAVATLPSKQSPPKPDLTSIGSLRFEPDAAGFQKFSDGQFPDAHTWLELSFDESGAVRDCGPPPDVWGVYRSPQAQFGGSIGRTVCEQAKATAKFEFADKFTHPGGLLGLSIKVDFKARVQPTIPIRFRARGMGKQLKLTWDAKGRCSIPDALVTPANQSAICRAVTTNARATQLRESQRIGRLGTLNVLVWIDTKKISAPDATKVTVRETYRQWGTLGLEGDEN